MGKLALLKDTNPKAYEELVDFYPEYGINMYQKEELPANSTDYFGVWKCPSGKHDYITTIAYRKDADSDQGCLICKNNNKEITPRLLSMRNIYNGKRNVHQTLWYCDKCKNMAWYSNYGDKYVLDQHYCFESNVLSLEYPEIGKEWSNNNFVPADEIIYNPDLDYKFEWNCNICGMNYKLDMKKKVRLKARACPYCRGNKDIIRRPIIALYPKLSESWIYELNDDLINRIYEDDNKKRYLRCSKCGVVKFDYINKFIKDDCIFCKIGMTKEESSRIYREAEINTEKEYLNPEQVTPRFWSCEMCNNQYNLAPRERFFKSKECPYCSGKYVIPSKTSFKALYPELERELIKDEMTAGLHSDRIGIDYREYFRFKWKCPICKCIWKATITERIEGKECIYCNKSLYQLYKGLINTEWEWKNNSILVNPRYAFAESTKKVWWKCPKCKHSYKYSIYGRIKDYKRNRNSCIYCHGKIRVIRRN